MNAVEFIGEVEPWPSPRMTLPSGWSWGENERVAQIQAHKSRLILQADALCGLREPDAAAQALMRALYRGAAEWELWLFEHDNHATFDARKRCAHSALSLAELSGDLILVGRILAAWCRTGPTHARFYRDGRRRYEAKVVAFDRQIDSVRPLVNALMAQSDRYTAKEFLAATESFAREGGRGELVALRARALELLGAPPREVLRARFAMCVAFPLEGHAISAYMLALARLAPNEPLPPVLSGGVRWFRADVRVQSVALSLRDVHRDEALFGEPIADHVAHVSRLALSSEDESDTDYAIFFCAKHLFLRGAVEDALVLLETALHKHPHAPALRVFRAFTAHELGRADALGDLSAMIRETQTANVPSWLWRVAGEVFVRARHWVDAVVALRRGNVAEPTFQDVPWLNQYAVALVHVGAPDDARAVLQHAASLAPEEVVVRHNLEVLGRGQAEPLTTHPIDPFTQAPANDGTDRYIARLAA